MGAAIIENSAIVSAALKNVVVLRKWLRETDVLLNVVNKYSIADRALRFAARGAYRYIAKIYAGADMLKRIGGVILMGLRMIISWTTGFIRRIYYGSFVMGIFGRAAANSRWLK